MKNAHIRKEAMERIGYGFTRQMVFDDLAMAHPEVKPKKIACVNIYGFKFGKDMLDLRDR